MLTALTDCVAGLSRFCLSLLSFVISFCRLNLKRRIRRVSIRSALQRIGTFPQLLCLGSQFNRCNNSVQHRLIHHVAEQHAVILALVGGLQHQHGEQV